MDQVLIKNELMLGMNNATNYSEWLQFASQLDILEDTSSVYDYELLSRRLEEMQSAYSWADVNAVAFLLRTSMSRNIGNIGAKELYRYSRIGTKSLIEKYLKQTSSLIDYVVSQESYFQNISPPQLDGRIHGLPLYLPSEATEVSSVSRSPIPASGKNDSFHNISSADLIMRQLSFFSDLRHTLGNSALMLSGGATLGIHHIGVLKCLYEQKMLPRILCGSSAGAIVASMVAIRLDSELQEILASLDDVSWHFFEGPDQHLKHTTFPLARFARQLIRLIRDGAVFDSDVLSEFLREHVGATVTFLEAYNRTRRVLNVAVSSTTPYEMPRLLNYLTSPYVLIWTAVAASCAAPTLFKSSRILVKTPSGEIIPWSGSDDATWMDGSVENDLPISRIAHLFNVNPHVVPFLTKGGIRESRLDSFKRIVCHVLREEILFRLPMLIDFGLVPRRLGVFLRNILSQKYEGDVTIVPSTIALTDLLNIFTAPTSDRVHSAVLRGEHATWPYLAFIRSQTYVEMKLDRVLYALKCRLLEQSWSRAPRELLRPIGFTPSAELDKNGSPSNSNANDSSVVWNEEAAVPPLLGELGWKYPSNRISPFLNHTSYPRSR
ncbi:hypothetical protein DI09_42p50 [Mitosporidium daphniae]|uniref:PNPLA domain-containing protein n=1 Tax=Mitosporidium daphniae TaxID=1485682 RepID=A0A098VQ23_9MICR|nr:uncharacterized protein DI09_42p50 [Mitosporidium daphniae]KGG51162.1 hypothetical protein DI09_42p50 [Mitosporidium daphniae]|eukprot:XP_013237614.1 uncharacterized protein DI09_42p50 [Mitosporidium daphniae]